MFIAGLLLFSAASLAGGFADSEAFLLTARAVQGAGGALVAPAALSLITTTFPEGPPRNRALGVYAAMSIAGGAIGLIGGGLLTTYASWRWVLFVNVPIGAAVALAAPRVLAEAPRGHGRFDLPGAVTGTAGIAALVYGLISAATTPNGVSHWGDAKVLASLAAAAVLLAAFAVIETRTPQALLPVRLLRDRTRTGAYLSYAGVGIFIFGMFFFLTVFMQAVWGYSALKTGLAYLPFTAALFLGAGAVASLVPKIGTRPILLAGSALSTGGLYWLSRISEHDTYASAVLGPTMLIGAGAALLFVTLSLVALNRVPEADSGVASSLLNTGQQAGGSIGLAVLGTVAWTVVAHSIHAQAARADLQPCPRHRVRPRVPGRRRDRAAHPDHQHRRDPDPARRPRRRPATGPRHARRPGTTAVTAKDANDRSTRLHPDHGRPGTGHRDWRLLQLDEAEEVLQAVPQAQAAGQRLRANRADAAPARLTSAVAGALSINAQPVDGKSPGIASRVVAPPHGARADAGARWQATPDPGWSPDQ